MCVVGLQLESLKRSCERVRSVFTICHPGCEIHVDVLSAVKLLCNTACARVPNRSSVSLLYQLSQVQRRRRKKLQQPPQQQNQAWSIGFWTWRCPWTGQSWWGWCKQPDQAPLPGRIWFWQERSGLGRSRQTPGLPRCQ